MIPPAAVRNSWATATISNFRSIKLATVPLSQFVCAVGHNNAGKSSLLIALRLFYSGAKLDQSDFYDSSHDISIEVQIDDIDEDDLKRLDPVHAERIRPAVVAGRLTLVRRYPPNGKSSLKCLRLEPLDDRFSKERLAQIIKGSGAALRTSVLNAFPELAEQAVPAIKTQKDFEGLIDSLREGLPEDAFDWIETDLPTGLDNSILHMLPEPIYIPAVQDVRDELKTAETAGFGKILSVLMTAIHQSGKVEAIRASFDALNRLMNRTVNGETGEVVDDRLEELQQIESTVGRYLGEQFRGVTVELEVPPPSIKSVFGSARIILQDGVKGDVETKGDGVKRAVLFALFRTLLDLKRSHQGVEGEAAPPDGQYQFLFEEPELYLHPNAQRILYDALLQISSEHQVCVCTHSPYFFSPDDEGTFLRVRKIESAGEAPPYADIMPIDLLTAIAVRDAYQIICYENNSAAFFCDRVILVEGDCDTIFLQHVSRRLNPNWDFLRRNVAVVKIGGKGNFARYREFFEAFGVEVRIVADLDVLSDQFNKLGASHEASIIRDQLIQETDAIIARDGVIAEVSAKKVKGLAEKPAFRERYAAVRAAYARLKAGEAIDLAELPELDELFPLEREAARRTIIEKSPEIMRTKIALLDQLRREGINVLSAGAIENYYPPGCQGHDKPTRALHACQLASSREQVTTNAVMLPQGDGQACELDIVFNNLFDMPVGGGEERSLRA